jgi:hypothetical protein
MLVAVAEMRAGRVRSRWDVNLLFPLKLTICGRCLRVSACFHLQPAKDHCSLLVAGSCHLNCHFVEAILVAGFAPHPRRCSSGVGIDVGKTCLKNEETVVDCTAGGELHAAGLPPPSSSLLQRSRPSQTIGFCICLCWEEEDFDATDIDNSISSWAVRKVTRWKASIWKDQLGKHFRFCRPIRSTRKFSLARILLLLGITHCELAGGSQGCSEAADGVKWH